jgi:hypothetical protein
MGREVAMTPDQQLAFKQAQADMRAQQNAGLTIQQQQERQAQAQRDVGKKVEIPKDPKLQENINRMKAAVTSPPPPAIVPVGSSPALSMGGKIAEIKGGQEGVKPGGKIAEIKGGQEGVKMVGEIAEIKPSGNAPPKSTGSFSCYPGWELSERKCFEKCKEGEQSFDAPYFDCYKCPPGSGNHNTKYFQCTGPKGGLKDPISYKRRSMPAMFKP